MTAYTPEPAIGNLPITVTKVNGSDLNGLGPQRERLQSAPVRVLICEAEPLMTAGLKVSMQSPEIEVVGAVGTGRQLLTWAPRRDVDVVLIGTSYPIRGRAEIGAILKQLTCGIVIILDSSDHERFLSFLQAGIRGFISASMAVTEVSRAVKSVAKSQAYLSPALTIQLLDWLAERLARPAASGSAISDLSAREQEVLRLLGKGSSNADISRSLRIREATVRSHVYHILTKLNLRSRAEAVLYGFQYGLQTVDHPHSTRMSDPSGNGARNSRR